MQWISWTKKHISDTNDNRNTNVIRETKDIRDNDEIGDTKEIRKTKDIRNIKHIRDILGIAWLSGIQGILRMTAIPLILWKPLGMIRIFIMYTDDIKDTKDI